MDTANDDMRVLGVNCTTTNAFLAIVDAGVVVPDMPEVIEIRNGLALNSDLIHFRDEVRRRLTQIAPDLVVVLYGEIVRRDSHPSWTPRIAAETVFRLVAAESDTHSELPSARSLLGLPSSGKLESHVSSLIPSSVGKHWTAGRNIAALAALAVERRG